MTQAKTRSNSSAVAPSTSKGTAAKKSTADRPATPSRRGRSKPANRFEMIAEAAYYRAEKVDFMGDPVDHWLEAERAVDVLSCGQSAADAVKG